MPAHVIKGCYRNAEFPYALGADAGLLISNVTIYSYRLLSTLVSHSGTLPGPIVCLCIVNQLLSNDEYTGDDDVPIPVQALYFPGIGRQAPPSMHDV